MAAQKKYTYRVSGAAAVLRRADGSEAYLYKGATVTTGFTEESIKHCIKAGLIERVEVVDHAAVEAAAKAAADKAAADAKAKADAEKAKQEAAAAKAAAAS